MPQAPFACPEPNAEDPVPHNLAGPVPHNPPAPFSQPRRMPWVPFLLAGHIAGRERGGWAPERRTTGRLSGRLQSEAPERRTNWPTKRRHGREQRATGDVEAVRCVASLLREFEVIWRGRVDRMDAPIALDPTTHPPEC